MAPLFTATNVTTLLRKVVHAARYVHPRSTVPAGKTTRLRRTRLAVDSALRETYASLTPLGHQSHALQPIPISSRGFSSASRLHTTPLGRARQKFRMDSFRPSSASELRGSARVANIGLGSARTFATTGTFSASATQVDASILLRAFSDALQDDHTTSLLRPRRHVSCKPTPSVRRDQRRLRCRRGLNGSRLNGSSGSISSTASHSVRQVDTYCVPRPRLRVLDHYFPFQSHPADQDITLPPRPEDITTPGRTTTLSIDLHPSDEALLESTTSISFKEVEIGVTVFADLTDGLVRLMTAFSTYGSTRVIPLLARLEALGIISNLEADGPLTFAEVVCDAKGPTNLHIVFRDRSEADVRAIIGECLSGEVWFDIVEQDTPIPSSPGLNASLVVEADAEDWSSGYGSNDSSLRDQLSDPATKAWDDAPLGGRYRLALPSMDLDIQLANTSDLIMPSPDVSSDTTSSAFPQAEPVSEGIPTPPESFSWASVDGSALFTSPNRSPPNIKNAVDSLVSQDDLVNSVFSSASSETTSSSAWSGGAYPSDDNSGLDESFALSEVSGIGDELVPADEVMGEVADRTTRIGVQGEGMTEGWESQGSWMFSSGMSFDTESRW